MPWESHSQLPIHILEIESLREPVVPQFEMFYFCSGAAWMCTRAEMRTTKAATVTLEANTLLHALSVDMTVTANIMPGNPK